MPRRMITPEIWTNEKFGELDLIGKLTFIGLITNADDDGRIKGNPNHLKVKIFPYDFGITPDMVNQAVDRCHELKLIIKYSVNGGDFIYLCGWQEHQQIRKDRYHPSTLPQPPDNQLATIGKPFGNRAQPQSSLVKSSIVKDSIVEEGGMGGDKKTLQEYIRETLQDEFPDLDISEELKKFTLYWSEGKGKLKRPKTAFRNWLIKAREFKNGTNKSRLAETREWKPAADE